MHIDTAVIVEPRLHIHLEPVLNNMLCNLSFDTTIHVFHGRRNKILLETKYIDYINSGKIKLTNMNIDNLTVPQYSNILTSLNFWNMIEGESILIFQTDSCLCMPINEFDLTPYDNFGFVGAPCKLFPSTWQNGGLSLRKRSLMIEAIKDKKNNESTWPEDKYFSVVKRHIVKPSSYDLALKFSVEQYYSLKPLGIHKAWYYLPSSLWKKLNLDFPPINIFNNIKNI
jgi:hypothetical protein